jgi:hypothetical protein
MKRRILISARPKSRRRGALFHYYLAWVTLTSSILVMTGNILHTILQSDQTDRRVSLFLNSLLRCERILREDSNSSERTVESDSALIFSRDDGVQIRWASDRGILTRLETQDGKSLRSDRFVFPAGSRIEIRSRDDGSAVFKFSEPSAFVEYSAVGSGGLNRNKSVEESLPPTPSAAAAQPVTEIVLY